MVFPVAFINGISYLLLKGCRGDTAILGYYSTIFLLVLSSLFVVACESGGGSTSSSVYNTDQFLVIMLRHPAYTNLDLYVTEPSGRKIYPSNPASSSVLAGSTASDPGGESIGWWLKPSGNYVIEVKYISGIVPINYHIGVAILDSDVDISDVDLYDDIDDYDTFIIYEGTISYSLSRSDYIYIATVTHQGIEVQKSSEVNRIVGEESPTQSLDSSGSILTEYITDRAKEVNCIVDCNGSKGSNEQTIHNISTIKINTTMSDGEVVIYGTLINGSLINGTLESLY